MTESNNKLTYAQVGINTDDTDAVKREMVKSVQKPTGAVVYNVKSPRWNRCFSVA